MRIQIDPTVDAFLLDHVVDGSPLLPTVMQLDLVARALQAAPGGQAAASASASRQAGMLMRDIRVGPPLRFFPPGPRQLNLLRAPDPSAAPGAAAWHCELLSVGSEVPHLTAVAELTTGSARRMPAPGDGTARLPCGQELVYPPFFHGPAFRVVAAFGRTGAGLSAALTPGLPALSWGTRPTVLQPQLLELLLQCCGIQELADTGAMMVPASIEAVHWHPESLAAESAKSVTAVVRPRPGPHRRDRIYDGRVLTSGGTVLVTVTGYRATELHRTPEWAPARAQTARLARCLGRRPSPVPHQLAGTGYPEGAQR